MYCSVKKRVGGDGHGGSTGRTSRKEEVYVLIGKYVILGVWGQNCVLDLLVSAMTPSRLVKDEL